MSSTGQVEQWGETARADMLAERDKEAIQNRVKLPFLESTRTTKLYDRRVDEVTLDEAERIAI
jgi:hypothetical protein